MLGKAGGQRWSPGSVKQERRSGDAAVQGGRRAAGLAPERGWRLVGPADPHRHRHLPSGRGCAEERSRPEKRLLPLFLNHEGRFIWLGNDTAQGDTGARADSGVHPGPRDPSCSSLLSPPRFVNPPRLILQRFTFRYRPHPDHTHHTHTHVPHSHMRTHIHPPPRIHTPTHKTVSPTTQLVRRPHAVQLPNTIS